MVENGRSKHDKLGRKHEPKQYTTTMNTLKTTLVLTLTSALLFSCRKDHIHGTGHTIGEERQLSSFDNVVIQGPIKANISYGSEQQVTVRADEAAISKVHTHVSNNTLYLDLNESYNYHNLSFTVDVEMPFIGRLTQEGVSNSSLSGFYDLDALSIVHTGVGDLTLSGSATHLNIDHDGVGNLNAYGLAADVCDVHLDGVGNIKVTVNDLLQGSLNGVGNIYYRGHPTVDVHDDGVGHVIHVD